MATIASSLEHKCNVESKNLRHKLKKQLQKDIFRIYEESIFTDTYIKIGNDTLKLHRCMLQTRAPVFYHIYCNNSNIISIVPAQKLVLFFREIYCEAEIKSKEEELLKCIETAFSLVKPVPSRPNCDLEQSYFYSFNDTSAIDGDESDKLRLLKDITKVPALNSTFANYNYFHNSDNTVYYSLVDESLVLSDFSDVNEEACKEMSGCKECGNSAEIVVDEHENMTEQETPIINQLLSKDKRVNGEVPVIVEHLKVEDISCDFRDVPQDLCTFKENVKNVTTKYFQSSSAFNDDDIKESGLENKQNLSKGENDTGKFFKCFIDASDLIDDEKACREDNSELQSLNKLTETVDDEPKERRSEKQTPDSLDDDPCPINNDTVVVEHVDGHLKNCDSETQRLQSKLQNDFLQADLLQVTEPNEAKSRYDTVKVCDDEPNHSSCFFNKSVNVSNEMFVQFKSHLIEKYECAKMNHAYSDCELQRLKVFDELVASDNQLKYLKYHLEELINAGSSSKTDIAMHKFLIKQYEKRHGSKIVFAFTKAVMIDLLERRKNNSQIDVNCVEKLRVQNFEEDVTCAPKMYRGSGDTKEDIDELFRKLLKSSNQKQCKEKAELCTQESTSLREPVTNKSCGFFIDLKENNVKQAINSKTKEKSLPTKQLFSMFIDFGNSTDSDSSIEVQSKFEKRRNQYINKLEKSRELRNSVHALNDYAGGTGEDCKLKKKVQNTPLSYSITSTEKLLEENQQSNVDRCNEMSTVVQRCKSGSPHPREVRRSWNVDKTSEIDRNLVTKHKRSYSVSSRSENLNDVAILYAVNISSSKEEDIADEYPSIGNADSTNEVTMNGESEISNSYPHSECENDKKIQLNKNDLLCISRDIIKSDEINGKRSNDKNFVKLSDMDKEPKTSFLSNDQWPSIRMTKSATGVETNWFETKLLNGSVNSRSLSRIFPDLSASVLSKPNSDVDDTTISSISSVQSSSAISTCESNLEVSNSGNKIDNKTLGQDLLRMFLEEISTDVVVEVAGRRIKAHKCILTSRCQYFAALLSGGWVESAGNVLSVQGFSYNVVHFALCYIYSGESEIPENINIVELATLADYLCLEGLKEIVSCTLKMKYCHFFHKPCNICSVGVLECLPIAVNYGLDDIHRKSLRWITKHYVRLWPSKAFATLPKELIDKCYNQHVLNLNVNNVFETLMNCDKLFSFIPQTRWAEPCFVVTKKLHDHCIKFLANNFVEFLKSESFTSIALNRTWGIVIMDEKTQLACSKMRSDQLCQSYSHLSNECKLATESNKTVELIELLNRVKQQVETALIKIALQASQCSAWFQMASELRSHIQNSAGLTFLPSELKTQVDSFKSRQTSAFSASRAADLQQVKSAVNRPHKQSNVRSYETRQTKQSSNQKQNSSHARNTFTKQNGVQNKENKGAKNTASINKSPFRNKYANVKSRYMENKSNSKSDKAASTTPSEMSEVEKIPSASNKRSSKSLASSINLSPAIRHTARALSLSKIPVSVRNASQKRTESDKDTTSGSDNGVKSELAQTRTNGMELLRSAKRLTTSAITIKSNSAATKSNNSTTKSLNGDLKSLGRDDKSKRDNNSKSGRTSIKSRNGIINSSSSSSNSRCRLATNDSSKRIGRRSSGKMVVENGSNHFEDRLRLKDKSPETKYSSNPSSKTSLSEEINRPQIPFRRDGTFCIDEPTILKKHSPCSDHADEVI